MYSPDYTKKKNFLCYAFLCKLDEKHWKTPLTLGFNCNLVSLSVAFTFSEHILSSHY